MRQIFRFRKMGGWVAVRRRVGEVVGGGEGDIFRWDGFVRRGLSSRLNWSFG